MEAAKLMPPEFREGQYVRGGLGLGLVNSPQDANGENLWWLRAYGRQRGDEQWITIQRPRYDRGLVVQAAPGWTIVEQRGNRRNIVHVKRG